MRTKFIIKNHIDELDIKVNVANNFLERLKGLIGTHRLPDHEGIILLNCNAIHMCFMQYALDVIYVDEKYTIIKLVKGVKPWRISGCRQAKHTIELPIGTISEQGWEKGFQLNICKCD